MRRLYVAAALAAATAVTETKTARPPFALVTMVANTGGPRLPASYLLGACALAAAARRSDGDALDVLSLVTIDAMRIHPADAEWFALFGIQARLHAFPVMRDAAGRPAPVPAGKIWERSTSMAVMYVKLFAWSLAYERVVYLDSDCALTRPALDFDRLDRRTTWFARPGGGMAPVNGAARREALSLPRATDATARTTGASSTGVERQQCITRRTPGAWFVISPAAETFATLRALVYGRRYNASASFGASGWLGDGAKCGLSELSDQGLWDCFFRHRHARGLAVAIYDNHRSGAAQRLQRVEYVVRGATREASVLETGGALVPKAYEHFGGRHKLWGTERGTPLCDLTPQKLGAAIGRFRFPWSKDKLAAFHAWCKTVDGTPALRHLYRDVVLEKKPVTPPPCAGRDPLRPAAEVLRDLESCGALGGDRGRARRPAAPKPETRGAGGSTGVEAAAFVPAAAYGGSATSSGRAFGTRV